MRKSKYQAPMFKLICSDVVYGQMPIPPTPQGQCRSGNTPGGSDFGCHVGSSYTPTNCAFGTFPATSVCSGGSDVGFANQCNAGTNLT
jgi:hypothetical protein